MKNKSIAIIDYGMGNLHSVASAIHKIAPNVKVLVTDDPHVIANASHVIFPGVGAMRDCMAEIRRLNFDKAVLASIASGKPMLAICVGMQALMEKSDENDGVSCIGHFKGKVRFFAESQQFRSASDEGSLSGEKLKVPHMGWNQVEQVRGHPLWNGIENNSRFYFVHSYFVEPSKAEDSVGVTHYGINFTASIADKNVFAVQFHPEKSHTNGLRLLSNFIDWNGL